jgi:hypothetical protein
MTEKDPERKRRKIVIDWKREEKTTPRRRSARGSHPRFDRARRNIILVGLLLIVVMLAAGFMSIRSARNENVAERRNFSLRPRSIDIWTVYPDGSLRFVKLIYSARPARGQEVSPQVRVAGPLVAAQEEVTERWVIGGTSEGIKLYAGPGDDSNLVYEQFTLTRNSSTKPYGVDVTSRTSPYISRNETTGDTILSLGTQAQTLFQQVIVAVALPSQAEISAIGNPAAANNLEPYRQINVGDWQVMYFDTTRVTGTEAIHVYYRLLVSTERPKLNYLKIDRRR